MLNEPLQPFAPPSALSNFVTPASGIFIEWFVYTVLLFWTIYTLVAVYHWIKYSHAAAVAVPAISLHLVVSFVLISYALSGAFFL